MLEIKESDGFWQKLDQLLTTSNLIIDRPQGTIHPHYPISIYPFDYGYLEGTKAGDEDRVDVCEQ